MAATFYAIANGLRNHGGNEILGFIPTTHFPSQDAEVRRVFHAHTHSVNNLLSHLESGLIALSGRITMLLLF